MSLQTLRSKCALLITVCLFVLGAADRAAADSVTLEWDPSDTGVGYRVHVGVQSGSYTQHVDVGAASSFTLDTAVAGQRYCFAVSAYLLSSQLEGPNSAEVCGYSNAPPTLANPGNRTSTVGQAVTLQLVGSDPASQPLTYSATGLPPGLSLMQSTGYISGAGTTAGTYSVTAQAFDGVLTASQTFSWVMNAAAVDTTVPTASISTPTAASTYSTTSSTMAFGGTASDNVGVTQVRWSNDRGGSGVATGTTNWSIAAIPLVSGANVITITAVDAAGNQGTDSITATYSSADTTRPTATISAPTTGTTFSTTASTIGLGGTASDSVGVTQVRWSSDRGGSGVATGTTSWSVSSLPLLSGANVITVTAVDAAGNQGTDSLTVTYTTADTTLPTATINAPTTGTTFSTTASTIVLGGTAADNVGVTQVRWSSDRGGSGVATGTTSWSISGVPLQGGANVITVTAVDAAGNQGTDALSVTYTVSTADTTLPTVSVSTPTTSTYYSAYVSTVALGGAAADNVGVTQVRWSNDRGGAGVATGTTSWSIPGLALLAGANGITVTAVDAAGNQATDFISVYYNVPTSDTTLPTVSISTPTSNTYYSAYASTVGLGGAAADNVGVTQVRWSNDRGGSGVATGTTSWSISGLPLLAGANGITITAVDAAGNQATDFISVYYNVTSPPPTTVTLTATLRKNGRSKSARLTWTNAPWPSVHIYRNGMFLGDTPNDGLHTDPLWGRGTYTYRVCAPDSTTNCSNTATVSY